MADEELALLALIASYGLQDVEDIRGRRKGRDIAGPPSDEELALQCFTEEAHALQTLIRDIAFARSIDEAVHTDAAILEEHERAEEIARGDREIARAIAEGRPPPTNILARSLSRASSVSTLATTSTATSSTAVSVKSPL